MASKITRRGFLGGSLTTTLLGGACGPILLPGERSPETPGTVLQEELTTVTVEAQVNGKPCSLPIHPEESALTLIREKLGLTGTKLSCGHGACGSCTVLLDGTPVASCLLPATALEGRSVRTIEGFSSTLHPMQKAFLGEDALQCGFCTPGFLVEAIAFYEKWRKEKGTQTPDRETIAEALSGHLCRCGAYESIYKAVQHACQGVYDQGETIPHRVEALAKVTGTAKYTVDIQYKNQLDARILRSSHGHALVTHLDWSKALAYPGVRGVVKLLNESGIVRYAGQEILALAAVDGRTAENALKEVDIQYKPLTVLTDMDASRAPNAPIIYKKKSQRKNAPSAAEGPLLPEGWDGNLRGPLGLFSKRGKKARRILEETKTSGGTFVEGTWRTQVQCHSCLEPHSCVAFWENSETLTVHLSTQAVHNMAHDIAERFALSPKNVRVLAKYVGGGFGSKAIMKPETIIAIELARITKAPVKVELSRREELISGGVRPAQEVQLQVAADKEGALGAMKIRGYGDAGVAVGNTVGIMFRLIYPDAPKDIKEWDVITNGPPGAPFRGPGGPPAFFALEQAVDEIAEKRGEDPITLRRRWEPHDTRKALYDWIETLPIWKDRALMQKDKGRYRRGIGLASATWFCFVQPSSQIQIEAGPDGIVASSACQDTGNGTYSAIAYAIAGVLGVSPQKITVKLGNSKSVRGPVSAGSRTTASVVPAAEHAAMQLRDELIEIAEDHFGLVDAKAGKGGVLHSTGQLPWEEVLAISPPLSFIGRRKRDKKGYFFPFGIRFASLTISKYLTGAVQLTEVEVDTRLGHIKVKGVWAGYRAGRLIVPKLAKSQAEGGIVQGISYALYEERRLDPKQGFLLTGGLEDYRIAGIGDTPPITINFIEDGFENIRGRVAGLGELVTLPVAPSLANAVAHATEWRPKQLPLRPDRILEGVIS